MTREKAEGLMKIGVSNCDRSIVCDAEDYQVLRFTDWVYNDLIDGPVAKDRPWLTPAQLLGWFPLNRDEFDVRRENLGLKSVRRKRGAWKRVERCIYQIESGSYNVRSNWKRFGTYKTLEEAREVRDRMLPRKGATSS